ncbi:hypothetical protein CR513_48265, partial [Mucuna pruriens]
MDQMMILCGIKDEENFGAPRICMTLNEEDKLLVMCNVILSSLIVEVMSEIVDEMTIVGLWKKLKIKFKKKSLTNQLY